MEPKVKRAPIVIIEELEGVRQVIRDTLNLEGYQITAEAEDGRRGYELLSKTSDPVVALVDWKMPLIEGDRLIRMLSAYPPIGSQHAYILMSARGAGEFAFKRLSFPSHLNVRYLQKPFDLEDLSDMVRKAVEEIVLLQLT